MTPILAKIAAIDKALKAEFKSHSAPIIELIEAQTHDPFCVLVGTILSARTKDACTAGAVKRLFAAAQGGVPSSRGNNGRARSPSGPHGNNAPLFAPADLERLTVAEIEKLIFPVGFYHDKAKHLKALPKVLKEKFGGILPNTVEELCELPGVGRKTANLTVAVGFDLPAICVDVHVHRISNRLKLVKTKTPLETEMALRKLLPVKYWKTWNSHLVSFGQTRCGPLHPKCADCPIAMYCSQRRRDAPVASTKSMSTYSHILRLYDAYVDTFRAPDGTLPEMMQLKRAHTAFVVKNAELIADGEAFDPVTREVALIAALLHDTGRYEQLKRYNTFKDSESVDHAVFSYDIVRDQAWLDQIEVEKGGGGGQWKDAILKAILYHNRRDLPEEIQDPFSPSTSSLHLTSLASHTVRDADKLDIFRVLEERLANPAWRNDTRAFWNLQIEAPPNPEVVRAIEELRPVDYNAIRSLADFVLIQIGWMVSGLTYPTSRRLCRERGHLAFRRKFLHTLTDDPSIDRLCNLADASL